MTPHEPANPPSFRRAGAGLTNTRAMALIVHQRSAHRTHYHQPATLTSWAGLLFRWFIFKPHSVLSMLLVTFDRAFTRILKKYLAAAFLEKQTPSAGLSQCPLAGIPKSL